MASFRQTFDCVVDGEFFSKDGKEKSIGGMNP